MTTEEFITRANECHNNRYDYSLVNYTTAKTKVKIICKKHGVFEQRAEHHLNGVGCKKCFFEKLSALFKSNTDNFIRKADIIHNHQYDYSKTNYINVCTKVKITCPIHGEFKQTPNAHLGGSGCLKCSYIKRNEKTTEQFIKEAKLTHKNKYDYSMAKYDGAKKKIKIICPIHGIFEQTPTNHISGKQGCPLCKKSHGELTIENFFKNNNIIYEPQKRFNNCKYIKPLPFDFYIPEYNTCIEFDGKQHEKSIKYFGGNIEFEKRKIKDKIKTEYCKANNIPLIRISYKDNIEKLLNLFLF